MDWCDRVIHSLAVDVSVNFSSPGAPLRAPVFLLALFNTESFNTAFKTLVATNISINQSSLIMFLLALFRGERWAVQTMSPWSIMTLNLSLMPKMNFDSPCQHQPSVSLFTAVVFKFNCTLVMKVSIFCMLGGSLDWIHTFDRRQQICWWSSLHIHRTYLINLKCIYSTLLTPVNPIRQSMCGCYDMF